jgi:beta-ketodecanoyl-[acyl-carrier-protein] synthase
VTNVVICGTGLFTPSEIISNDELVASFNTYVDAYNAEHASLIQAGTKTALEYSNAAFIEKASGIKQRHVMNKSGILDPNRMRPDFAKRRDDEPSLQCEMAYAAAMQALSQANRHPEDIDAIYMACSNFERPYPAMAIELQAMLSAKGYAIDLNVACSSAVFGLNMAVNALQNKQASCILVVNPEICSAHLNFRDRDSHFIFGDACTASILELEESAQSAERFVIIDAILKTDYSNHIRNNMGFLWRTYPQSDNSVMDPDRLFRQEGRKVFKEVTVAVSDLLLAHLEKNHLTPQDLKRAYLHQANASMNQFILSRLMGKTVEADYAPIILDSYANTSSAGSMIAFHLHREGLQAGDLAIICAFGAGYSMGNLIIQKL